MSIDWICFAVVCRLISNLNLNLLFAYLEMSMASPSNTRQLFVLLCPLFVLLQNSRCAPAADQWGNNTVNSTVTTTLLPALPTNSSIETTGSVKGNTSALPSTNPPITWPDPSAGTACPRQFVNITVDPPRADCMPGLMVSVPTCSGACNSYFQFLKANPYRVFQCSCCQATTYRLTKRIVTFQCGSTTQIASYNIAAAINCGCSSCGSLPLISNS